MDILKENGVDPSMVRCAVMDTTANMVSFLELLERDGVAVLGCVLIISLIWLRKRLVILIQFQKRLAV
jgi:hypothetical protein